MIAAKFMSLKDVGIIGILLGYFTLLVFVIGLEYWYYSNRKISKHIQNKSKLKVKFHLYHQFALYFFIYLMFLPLSFVWFQFKYGLGLQVSIITICLHLSQELSRILVYFNKQVLSSLITFLVQSLWIFPVIVMWMFNREFNVKEILNIHLLFSVISLVGSIILFIKATRINILDIRDLVSIFEFKNIKIGLKGSFVVYISTISYKVSELIGRFIFEFFSLYKYAGVFSFYQNIANISQLIIFYTYITFQLPVLMEKSRERTVEISFFRKIVMLSTIMLTLNIVLGFFAFKYIYKEHIYIDNFLNFILINIGVYMINISTFFTYMSYARKIDKVNVLPNLLSIFLSLIIYILVIFIMGHNLTSISLAFVIWSGSILFIKYFLFNKTNNIQNEIIKDYFENRNVR